MSPWITTRIRWAVCGICLGLCLPSFARSETSHEEIQRLVSVLQSPEGTFERAKACQRLAVVGDASAVEALAKLLPDPQLSAYARSALEGIAGESARAVLRQSLGELPAAERVGVLHSLGRLRDNESVEQVVELLGHADIPVQRAAAEALGAIGTPAAAEHLQDALEQPASPATPALAAAGLACAQRLAEADQLTLAQSLLRSVESAAAPEYLTAAATYDLILWHGLQESEAMLRAEIASSASTRFHLGLQAARRLGDTAADSLLQSWKSLPPVRQAQIIAALGDIAPSESLPILLEAARSTHSAVRVAALEALGQQSDTQAVAALWDSARSEHPEIAAAAQQGLSRSPAPQVDEQIVQWLTSENPFEQRLAITLAGRRRITAASGTLLTLVSQVAAGNGQAAEALRLEALQALGETVDASSFSRLLEFALAQQPSPTRETARSAVQAAVYHLPRAEAVAQLQAAYQQPDADRLYLLEQLAAAGGEAALETIANAAASTSPELQDAATRLLGEWLTPDAAPWLLQLASQLPDQRLRTRALRGAIRIARQLDMPDSDRVAVCQQALELAERDDERTLVLDALQRYPSSQGLGLAVEMLRQPQSPAATAAVAVEIAERVAGHDPHAVAEPLRSLQQLVTNPSLLNRLQALKPPQP